MNIFQVTRSGIGRKLVYTSIKSFMDNECYDIVESEILTIEQTVNSGNAYLLEIIVPYTDSQKFIITE